MPAVCRTHPSPALAMALVKAAAESPPLNKVLGAAVLKAWRSGSAGFLAGTIQVLAFMWLRTAMNYQYKFGGTLMEVLRKLHSEGGVARLYRGLFPWAIFQAPLSRFGDVAANDMVLALMAALFPQVPVSVNTFISSMAGASWRIIITPVDTCKTVLQTDGSQGWKILMKKISTGGFMVLWAGWEGNYVANVVGNYPWFFIMNWLQKNVKVPSGALMKLVRSAVIGAAASSVSDVVSNSIRVIKTKKQTHPESSISYFAATKEIIEKDGLYGVLFRGLETRIYTNVLQGAFFTVLWKYLSSR
eukprot:CAMPEP_0204605368 /NCGR_PEP_ID=MMETSP0661-20131031/58439_1 /ASSEMBLY_ACC=CAM_ASM_000606 /TAXON_ID=109239 /ORGANISM="Alexandrium margalefi, Strain AMGDE01CS-322" /LENGTH=301 /DNA_ID=CAMNT_0051616603 /DNA_START=85 /DNA_END=990 /DNA_ORIENTATION=-